MSLIRRILGRDAAAPRAPVPEWCPDAQLEARLRDGASWPDGLPLPAPQLRRAYLFEPATVGELIERLREVGMVCLPGAIGGALLTRLGAEFDDVMNRPDALGASIDRDADSVNVRLLRNSMDMAALPAIHAFFSSAWMDALCARYFGDDPYLLNYEIFVHQTRATDAPPSAALHLDRRQTLKFWIYPEDVPVQGGPMRVVPGSHVANARAREAFMESGRGLGELPHLLEDGAGAGWPIVGPAGTVFIQDTDAGHGASPVAAGHRRRIMRGHCRSRRVHEWAAKTPA